MVPHFFRTLLQLRSVKLSKWTLVAEAQVELLRCGYGARCSPKAAATIARRRSSAISMLKAIRYVR